MFPLHASVAVITGTVGTLSELTVSLAGIVLKTGAVLSVIVITWVNTALGLLHSSLATHVFV